MHDDVNGVDIRIAHQQPHERLQKRLGLLGIVHVGDIAEIARRRGPAVHVDAAWIVGIGLQLRDREQSILESDVVAVPDLQYSPSKRTCWYARFLPRSRR